MKIRLNFFKIKYLKFYKTKNILNLIFKIRNKLKSDISLKYIIYFILLSYLFNKNFVLKFHF